MEHMLSESSTQRDSLPSRLRKKEQAQCLDSLACNKTGNPIPNLSNVVNFLKGWPDLADLVALDEFANRIILRSKPPWQDDEFLEREWTSDDDSGLQIFLQDNDLNITQPRIIMQAIAFVAKATRFHSVQDYLYNLNWDGAERVRYWLHTYLGCGDTSYHSKVGQMFLISAIARILKPGCKADHIAIFEGKQGSGKSTAVQILAGHWACEHIPDLHHKDAMAQLSGMWLIELSELSAMKGREAETIKSFLSRQTDRYRPAYGARPLDFPRQCIFVGTTNTAEYLHDLTGNRRFWPIQCGDIDLTRLREDRGQLWAEALQLYRNGVAWWPTNTEETELFAREQEQRREEHPWEGQIAEYLEVHRQHELFLPDIISEALNLELKAIAPHQARAVSGIAQRHGWRKKPRRNVDGKKLQPYEYVGNDREDR